MDDQYPDEEEGDHKRGSSAPSAVAPPSRGGGVALVGGLGRFYGWPSSRIVRVSRASGGKDRHSKVLTSKGLRDRRMRLSVNTAIQFYDLQDRLGLDQPSKAVEWLLKAAAASIAELPPMNSPFPDTPKQLCGEKRSTTAETDHHHLRFGLTQVDMEDGCGDPDPGPDPTNTQPLPLAIKSSASSSNSETSKGSISRSASRMKARERAKERVAEKEKEKEIESSDMASLNPISHTTSFTELLNGGGGGVPQNRSPNESNFVLKSSPRQQHQQWSSTPMDYFTTGLLGLPSSSGQMQLAASPSSSPLDHHQHHHPELQHFSFVSDHLVHVVAGNGNSGDHNNNGHHSDYNLNFTISPSANSSSLIAGFNRGTLQSNSSSPSLLPHFQRFPDGSPGFFIGTALPVENYHQFLGGYDARSQYSYGDSHQHSSKKGKAKS